jgi:thymidylate kinase
MTRNGRWICIDGVEGAGKTTLSRVLAPLLRAEIVSEFSDTPFGRALGAAVRVDPHYISKSRTAQSLVFIGDFIELHCALVAPAVAIGSVVLQDRGYLSKFAYQYVVVMDELGPKQAAALLDYVLALLPPPDLTLYLTAPIGVIERRLLDRDGHAGSPRLAFIEAADAAARGRLARKPYLRHAMISTDKPIADSVAHALDVVGAGDR